MAEQAKTISATGTITKAEILEPRFPQNAPEGAFDLNFIVKRDDNGEEVEISLEVSFAPLPNNTQMTRYETTMHQLKTLGYQYGEDLSQLGTLVGVNCGIYGKQGFSKKTGNEYWTWYFSSQTRRAVTDFAARIAKMRAAAAAVTGTPAGGEEVDPFA